MDTTPLESFPPESQWDEFVDYDPDAWPKKVERRSMLVPTICFNCEAACGLMAFVDKENLKVRKLEGNPYHPGSRGKNCAKGPATINQIEDPNRILYPMRRVGPRGSGKFEKTTWHEVLDTFAARIRKALLENRQKEIMYHVGRPGEDGYVNRVLQSWGIDGHNSHTNVCSASARVGYALWSGSDRPSPDHANAKFILMLSAHLETGHYFNPHAQRIMEGKTRGAKIAVVDVRLSNTATKADYWLAPWPGTEPFLLLAIANVMLQENLIDRGFLQQNVNWEATYGFLTGERPEESKDEIGSEESPLWSSPEAAPGPSFDAFLGALKDHYAPYTPEAAAEECGVDAEVVRTVAREIGAAGSAFATHVWRNAAAGNEGGWQVARCLQLLTVLAGAVGTEGGTNLHSDNKYVPAPFSKPEPQKVWSELLYPKEWPLAYHELSFLLPHFLEEGRGKLDVYFTRVYNPVWTNPDGLMWEKMLRDESKVGLHAALTPVWSETAQYADYVLPMGNGAERHDLMSQETHASKWIGFRQPVLRVARERMGETIAFTYQANPGEVWEEAEFWIELSWRVDPDGSLGIRKHYESPYRPGEKVTLKEYYSWIFENSVPGLPEAAASEGLSPYGYMSKYGAFEVKKDAYHDYGHGFKTPSGKLELYSPTMKEWGWEEQAMPGYVRTHVHRGDQKPGEFEFVLVPTFRIPTLIHTRSANSKWLYELSNANPVWFNPSDAARLGVKTGDLVKVKTRIGHYVNKAWVTEGLRPGVVACSHHLGRWRLFDGNATDQQAAPKVVREELSGGVVRFRRTEGIGPYASSDKDTGRIWWTDGGVHQNLTFGVQPDPVSGQHCWHQRVVVEKAGRDDRYGDVVVDTGKSMEVYREWLGKTKPAQGPLRRPLWMDRVLRPAEECFRL
ncbi:MAG: molybdopterin-dependent oxidoreductase [Fimbriimonadaceae bacterium]|nr:molybdopterin-dependent oxidoreductase [Fimbriimonadaceae bacterium]